MIDREQAWNDLCTMPNKVEQLEKKLTAIKKKVDELIEENEPLLYGNTWKRRLLKDLKQIKEKL